MCCTETPCECRKCGARFSILIAVADNDLCPQCAMALLEQSCNSSHSA